MEEAGAALYKAIVQQDLEAVIVPLRLPADPNHWEVNRSLRFFPEYCTEVPTTVLTRSGCTEIARTVRGFFREIVVRTENERKAEETWGSLEITTALLLALAKTNDVPADGVPALCQAAAFGNLGAARALSKARADVDIQSKPGRTPLCHVVVPGLIGHPDDHRRNDIPMLRLLCAARADVNIVDGKGRGEIWIAGVRFDGSG